MPRIALADATAAQLRTFVELDLGIPVGERENRPNLLAKISEAGYGLADILVREEPATPSAQDVTQTGRRRTNSKGVVEIQIVIAPQNFEGGSDDVFVGVNGIGMRIPVGKAAWVPEHYVEALNNAETFVYPEFRDGLGGLSEPRAVKAYPFSYV